MSILSARGVAFPVASGAIMTPDGTGNGPTELVIGTRGSVLARWQAERVAAAIGEAAPGAVTRLEIIRTEGDRRQDVPFAAFAGRGIFVKELEAALVEGRCDIAVHSAKDVPTDQPEGLLLAAALPRDDPRDALVGRALAGLPHGARVGTGSPRRRASLARLRPDLRFEDLRGNLDTRLRRLDEGLFDAICLACAGLDRLGLSGRIAERLDPDICVPAPGQGIIAVEARAGDEAVLRLLARVSAADAMRCLAAERAVLRALGGGCQVPIGALATVEGGRLRVRARVSAADGGRSVGGEAFDDADRPDRAGTNLGERLLAEGAGDILRPGRR